MLGAMDVFNRDETHEIGVTVVVVESLLDQAPQGIDGREFIQLEFGFDLRMSA